MPESRPEAEFSTRLREIRAARNLTQAELAQRAGFQASAIAHFEADRRKPSFENVRRLARALEVSTNYLLGVEEVTAFRHEDKLTPDDRAYIQGLINRLTGGEKP